MIKLPQEAPPGEQSICVTCGFCCDGTLFAHACLLSGERGHLPEKIEQHSFSEGDNDYFRLPCDYFSAKCTIYDRTRADVCSAYRCQLLRDFAEGRVPLEEALDIVRQAILMREKLIEQYHRITGNNTDINFRQLLIELGKIQKTIPEKETAGMDIEMLVAGCNIFEALLIKNIRSASDFESLIMGPEHK